LLACRLMTLTPSSKRRLGLGLLAFVLLVAMVCWLVAPGSDSYRDLTASVGEDIEITATSDQQPALGAPAGSGNLGPVTGLTTEWESRPSQDGFWSPVLSGYAEQAPGGPIQSLTPTEAAQPDSTPSRNEQASAPLMAGASPGRRPGSPLGAGIGGGAGSGGRATDGASLENSLPGWTADSFGALTLDGTDDLAGLRDSSTPPGLRVLSDATRSVPPGGGGGSSPGSGGGGGSSPGGPSDRGDGPGNPSSPGDDDSSSSNPPGSTPSKPGPGGGIGDGGLVPEVPSELGLPPGVGNGPGASDLPAPDQPPATRQVPEPSILALFGLGLAAALRRRAGR
jgi:hypothetical protein